MRELEGPGFQAPHLYVAGGQDVRRQALRFVQCWARSQSLNGIEINEGFERKLTDFAN